MNIPRPASLRRRLMFLLLSLVTVLWLATAVTSYFDTRHEIDELFDAQLAQAAQLLLAQASHDIREIGDSGEDRREYHKYQQKVAFQIWDEKRNLLLRSAGAPLTPLAGKEAGYSDSRIEGHAWRVFARWDERHEFQIQVGERYAVRDELAGHVALRMLYPLLFALPLLAVLIWLSVGRGLAPLRRVSAEVMARAPQNPEPLEVENVPAEIRPLVQSLNTLFGRVRQAFENERRFTADAAHELRTPLAALKTQAQVALRAADEEQRRLALQQVLQGVDRATHLVEQLLTLARLDPQTALPAKQLSLRAIATQVLSELAPDALAKGIEIALEDGAEGLLMGDATALDILVRNLADNAIRYTPRNGRIQVVVREEHGQVVLQVTDSGPGIPPEERSKALQRFYRVLGSGESGSGLGLSIVQRIAELHGAGVLLETPESGVGLRVRVIFPVPPTAG